MTTDIQLEDYDLKIDNGDFVVAESAQQHVEHILVATKGQYRQSPLVGVGIIDYLASPWTSVNRNRFEREVRLQLEADGARNVQISLSPVGELEILNAEYP